MNDWSKFVYYDETSPSCLRWACDRGNGVCVGDVVGTFDKDSRWSFVVTAFGSKRRRYCHRIIWELLKSETLNDTDEIDHEDGVQWNNKFDNLRKVTSAVNSRNVVLSSRNTTGICGVSRNVVECSSGSYSYWVASWKTLAGRRKLKSFSVLKLGEETAKAKAIAHRAQVIAQMNAKGAGYTDRHGTKEK